MNIWRRWQQKQVRRGGKRADAIQEKDRWRQWFLLAGRCDISALTAPPVAGLRPLYPPSQAFWADPFVWARDGRFWVFFEDFSFASQRGRISVIELDDKAGRLSEAVPVIEEPHHLSYPFLFEFDDVLYMVPEKAGEKRVDLYRCVVFPHQWELVMPLVDGVALADSTLLEHEGRWWLFCATRTRRLRFNESLLAFYADSPLTDKWIPHRANPLVRDFSVARPAGRIIRDEADRVLRPSQDCVRRYGHGLNISEILSLSPGHYEEHRIWHASGEQAGGWRAMHHMDWRQDFIVMDAQRLIDRPKNAG